MNCCWALETLKRFFIYITIQYGGLQQTKRYDGSNVYCRFADRIGVKRSYFMFPAIILCLLLVACDPNDESHVPQTDEIGVGVSAPEETTTEWITVKGWYYATPPSTEPPTERPIINEPPINIIKELNMPCKPKELLRTLEALHIPIISPKEARASYDPDYDDEAYWKRQGLENYVNDGRWYNPEIGTFSYKTSDGDWFSFMDSGKMSVCTFESMRFSTGEGIRVGDSIEQVLNVYRANEKPLSRGNALLEATTKDGAYWFRFEDGQLEAWGFAKKAEDFDLLGD